MIKTPLFKKTFYLLILVGILNWMASTLYLYWTVWWFDMIMHFSAGITVAMAGVLLHFFYNRQQISSIKTTLLVAFIAVLVVGILWEIFEIYFGIATLADGIAFYTDTASDLVLDISGGILGGLYAHRLLVRNN